MWRPRSPSRWPRSSPDAATPKTPPIPPAVKGNRLRFNPQGLCPWDRFGPEEALQIQWAPQALHPDLFTDLDMCAETRDFYQKFFHYEPTEADRDLILQVEDK
ncbi:hypothetical protein [Frankia canadensis]|uniref:hypothetical protein n=1 Tax=Frankia canadensis TaxID=1836972 RepID=UPI001A9C30B5|nr:hypothetical protein [Frankia canadensis]